jgi:hypothetical protein
MSIRAVTPARARDEQEDQAGEHEQAPVVAHALATQRMSAPVLVCAALRCCGTMRE